MQLTMQRTMWGQSKVTCPDCGGDCLMNDETIRCIECDFECERDTPEGRRLVNRHYN